MFYFKNQLHTRTSIRFQKKIKEISIAQISIIGSKLFQYYRLDKEIISLQNLF